MAGPTRSRPSHTPSTSRDARSTEQQHTSIARVLRSTITPMSTMAGCTGPPPTPLPTCRRSTPSPTPTVARAERSTPGSAPSMRKVVMPGTGSSSRPPLHRATSTIQIGGSAPPCTQPSSLAGNAGPSLQPRNRITRGQKRARKLQQRSSRKGPRVGSDHIRAPRSSTHPSMTGDGIIDATRPTKRLVVTQHGSSRGMEVRNLNSEVECEVQINDSDGDEDKSTEESEYESDPEANEAPSDDTFTL